MTSALLALSLVSAFASHPARSVAPPQPVDHTGELKETGGGPMGPRPLFIRDDGQKFLVNGPGTIKEELLRLSGVKVHLYGVMNDPRVPRGQFWVEKYQIVDVGGGNKPHVGQLALLNSGKKETFIFVTESGLAYPLPQGWVKKRKLTAGSKLWIISQTGEVFKPVRYARLRNGPATWSKH